MSINILVVDDDPVQCRLLEAAIEKFGYTAKSVNGGEAALALLKEEDFSLMILDLVMPDLDGMAILGRLREAKSTMPVIVQTSQGGIDTVVSAMRAGAFDFVVKPASPERLNVSIQHALTLNTLENELQRVKRSLSGFRAPIGSTSPSCTARNSFTCISSGSSPTSSRNKVPPFAS